MTDLDTKGASTRETSGHRIRILVIGSLPPPLGGTAISLKHLVDQLATEEQVRVRVVNTTGIRGSGLLTPFRFIKAMCEILVSAFRVDVLTTHVATNAVSLLGFPVLLIARLTRRPLVVRKFAGTDYREMSPWSGRVAHFVLRHADFYLAQTRELVSLANDRGIDRAAWFPTSRSLSETTRNSKSSPKKCRRFVYVGHVREYKGMRELKFAAEGLGDGVSVDVYGPWFPDLETGLLEDSPGIQYQGVLAPEDVVSTLSDYDALVLPTKAPTEGYPGAILEAYAAGLPVVTTRCGAIPELVDEQTGLLVDPGDANALREAMLTLTRDDARYRRLCKGASERAREFSLEVWAGRFIEYCRQVVRQRRAS